MQSGDPHEHDGQEETFGHHADEHPRTEPPAVVLHMLPGEEPEHREHREEKIGPETKGIEEMPQPDVGAVAGRSPPQEEHAPLVREHEREREDETRQRHP